MAIASDREGLTPSTCDSDRRTNGRRRWCRRTFITYLALEPAAGALLQLGAEPAARPLALPRCQAGRGWL